MFEKYSENVVRMIHEITEKESEHIKAAAHLMYQAGITNKKVFIEGSGHSHIIGEEIYARAGGYAGIVPMLESELMLHQHPMKSTMVERSCGYAKILLDMYHVQKEDVLILVSNSGRNILPVEMALDGQELGAHVIAITNLKHSSAVTSRHSSGNKLMDIAEIVIDNCGEYGDAAFKVDPFQYPIGATSTITGAFIAQSLIIEMVNEFAKNGIEPKIFQSSNIDGADERNLQLMGDLTAHKYNR